MAKITLMCKYIIAQMLQLITDVMSKAKSKLNKMTFILRDEKNF